MPLEQLAEFPSHLQDVREAYEKALNASKEQSPEQAAQITKEHTFDFRYETPEGKVYAGKFTCHVLSLKERQIVGILRARYGAGTAYEVLDDFTRQLSLMIAHLEVALTQRPAWAKELTELEDYVVLQRIYEEVTAHEARFLGYVPNSSAGETTGTDRSATAVVGK